MTYGIQSVIPTKTEISIWMQRKWTGIKYTISINANSKKYKSKTPRNIDIKRDELAFLVLQ